MLHKGAVQTAGMHLATGAPADGKAGQAGEAGPGGEAVQAGETGLLWLGRLWGGTTRQFRSILGSRSILDLSVMLMHAIFADYTRSKFGWDQKAIG